MKIGKHGISVVPVDNFTPVDIDWTIMKDDQPTRDMIDLYRQREYQKRAMMGYWDAKGSGIGIRDLANECVDVLKRHTQEENPLIEMAQFFIINGCLDHSMTFSWFWNTNRRNEEGDPLRNLAHAEVFAEEIRGDDNPYESGNSSRILFEICFRGHGDGDAFLKTNALPFPSHVRHFIHTVSPLIAQMGKGANITLRLDLKRYVRDYNYMNSRSDTILQHIAIYCGDLALISRVNQREPFDSMCRSINHSTVYLRHKNLPIKNHRQAIFVCSRRGVSLHMKVEDKLAEMMLGDSPTEDEFMMIEMAGYKKEEFWLDTIKSFNRMEVQTFNHGEAKKWYELTVPRFQF